MTSHIYGRNAIAIFVGQDRRTVRR